MIECKTCGDEVEFATSEGICDICVLEEKKKDDELNIEFVRRSHIELYKRCPHAFYMEVVKGVKQDQNIYALMGIDLHDLFEEACYEPTTSKGMLKSFAPMWEGYDESLFKDSAFKDKMWQRAVNSIEGFHDVLPTLPIKPFKTEETIFFEIDEDLPKVRITMDRIDEEDGKLHVRDWKTGKLLYGNKLTTDLQAPLYIHAVKQEYDLPVESFTFHYVGEKKERVFTKFNEDKYVCKVGKKEYIISLDEKIKEVKSIFSQIKNKNFNVPTKKNFFACKMCTYREKGLCEGQENETWKNVWG